MKNNHKLEGFDRETEKLLHDLLDLRVTLYSYGNRLSRLEDKTEKRQRPKNGVINTHKSFVKTVYGGKCACCMHPLKNPEIDHFSSRAWAGVHDVWVICGKCNRDLYHGGLSRAEIFPTFVSYQYHLKRFIGGEQLTLLHPEKKVVFYASELAPKS